MGASVTAGQGLTNLTHPHLGPEVMDPPCAPSHKAALVARDGSECGTGRAGLPGLVWGPLRPPGAGSSLTQGARRLRATLDPALQKTHTCVCLLGSKLAETGRVYSCGSQNTKAGVGVKRRAPEVPGA